MNKLFVLLSAVLIPLNCCMADEAEDAVELLSEALKCPNKSAWVERDDQIKTYHIINRFVGDTKTLRVQTDIRFHDRAGLAQSFSANFADLREVLFRADGDYVVFSCGTSASCVTREATGSWVPYPLSEESGPSNTGLVVVCDKDTAKSVKLAVDALIRLNKSATPPEPEEELDFSR